MKASARFLNRKIALYVEKVLEYVIIITID